MDNPSPGNPNPTPQRDDPLAAVEARHVIARALGDRLSLQRMGLINRQVVQAEEDRIIDQYRGDDAGLLHYYCQILVETLSPNSFHPTWSLLTRQVFEQLAYLSLRPGMQDVRETLRTEIQGAQDRVGVLIEGVQLGLVGPGPQPSDLNPEVNFDDLPRKVLEEGMFDMDGGQTNCSICMSAVEVGVEIIHLSCGHWFHPDCIIQWLSVNRTCPLCRQAVQLT